MTVHFGPKWYWEWDRPEAIRARAQMARDHKTLPFTRPTRQANPEEQLTAGDNAEEYNYDR